MVITLVAIAIAVWKLDLFVEDWRYGDGTCEVHGIEMKTVVVRRLAGPAPSIDVEFCDAMERDFPNCKLDFGENFYGKQRGKVFVCPDCQKSLEAYSGK